MRLAMAPVGLLSGLAHSLFGQPSLRGHKKLLAMRNSLFFFAESASDEATDEARL